MAIGKTLYTHSASSLPLGVNLGRQGVQELFLVNNKSLEEVNNACQSMVLPVWSVNSDWSVRPSWCWLQDLCNTFVISQWSVSTHLLLVVRSPFVGFVFVLNKSFVMHLYLLTSVKRLNCCK